MGVQLHEVKIIALKSCIFFAIEGPDMGARFWSWNSKEEKTNI